MLVQCSTHCKWNLSNTASTVSYIDINKTVKTTTKLSGTFKALKEGINNTVKTKEDTDG